MIDLHSHLLPGVDDGSPSIDVSVPVLQRFAADGVRTLVCTPHLKASRAASAPIARHREILASLIAHAPPLPELQLGWEIMLDAPGVDLSHPDLALGTSRAILVEFARVGVPARGEDELRRLRKSGVVPVVAHPERYWGVTPDMIRKWRAAGAVIQCDASILHGRGPMTRVARLLLEQGLVDCLASDNHGDARSLGAARRWLEEIGAGDQAVLLTAVNPSRVLGGEPMLPVSPVVIPQAFVARLRDLLLGRGA